MTPNTIIKPGSGFSGATLASTPFGTTVNLLRFDGGVFDANGTVQYAFWAHHATLCTWGRAPTFRNATTTDFKLGDPADSGHSYGCKLIEPQFYRTT